MAVFDLYSTGGNTPLFIRRTLFVREIQLVARVPQEGVILDVTPPTIGNVVPPVGTVLTVGQNIQFDVVDNLGTFSRILVACKFATGVQELVHDGDAFVGYYATQSSRLQIAGGFRYSILRAGGWPSAPTPRIFPIDSSGNDGT